MVARLVRALALAALVAGTGCDASQSRPRVPATPAASPSPSGVADLPVSRVPNGFPSDVPIPEGLVAQSVLSEHAGSYVALFTGALEPDTVQREFSEQLVAEGWTIDKSRSHGPEFALFAQKDERFATVIATRIDGKLHVELGIYGGD